MNSRRSSNGPLPRPGRSARGAATGFALLLIPVIVLAGGDRVRDFLNFGAGVLSLVSLSCSVIWGLAAQDRVFLNTRQRLVGQAVHRTTAVASIAFLLLHITTKIAMDHTTVIAAVVPFSLGVRGSGGLIGLGSVAALLMIFVGITGALRSNFASPAEKAARWRAMHMLAYPAWCAALVHGLYAGRQAKPVFVILYGLSLFGVMAALALRAAPSPFKRRLVDRVGALLDAGRPAERETRSAEAGRDGRGAGAARPERETPDARPSRGAPASPYGSVPPQYSPDGTGPQQQYVPQGAPGPQQGPGFAAAYRAVAPQQYAAPPPQPQHADPRWPVPSPPPVGEAPPSAYDPLHDTGHTIPAYGNPGGGGYGGSDVRDTGEWDGRYGTYISDDRYKSGPVTERPTGASHDTPVSGESWNTPSGGYE
ncbi:cytochrome b/b6 domain-containing protein [Streptomyces sp. NPDC008150]|uniref:cytochrome b/b6 domain-containing protein n=1 Tax=Streptomyces sp. NPDC008150 TaxID=3364816 RepID=UPI0036E03D37